MGLPGLLAGKGYSGFNGIYRATGIREVVYMAHIRCKLVDVFQAEGSVIAEETIKRIAGLSAIEKDGRSRPADVLSRIAEHNLTRIDELLPWRSAASAA